MSAVGRFFPHQYWDIYNESQDGLWSLLGFPTYENYFECMILFGFVGREHNRSGKPYFIKKTFEDAANNKVICWQYGTDKKPRLSILGKKKPTKGKKEGPLIKFWSC
jgi:hypothetical protein